MIKSETILEVLEEKINGPSQHKDVGNQNISMIVKVIELLQVLNNDWKCQQQA